MTDSSPVLAAFTALLLGCGGSLPIEQPAPPPQIDFADFEIESTAQDATTPTPTNPDDGTTPPEDSMAPSTDEPDGTEAETAAAEAAAPPSETDTPTPTETTPSAAEKPPEENTP